MSACASRFFPRGRDACTRCDRCTHWELSRRRGHTQRTTRTVVLVVGLRMQRVVARHTHFILTYARLRMLRVVHNQSDRIASCLRVLCFFAASWERLRNAPLREMIDQQIIHIAPFGAAPSAPSVNCKAIYAHAHMCIEMRALRRCGAASI